MASMSNGLKRSALTVALGLCFVGGVSAQTNTAGSVAGQAAAGDTITVSNPELKPQYSNNWDLTAEYYFRPQGMISIGAFQKKITDYIATDSSQFVGSGQDNGFDGQYVGYRITTSRNSGYAVIKGLEFSYQQQLV